LLFSSLAVGLKEKRHHLYENRDAFYRACYKLKLICLNVIKLSQLTLIRLSRLIDINYNVNIKMVVVGKEYRKECFGKGRILKICYFFNLTG